MAAAHVSGASHQKITPRDLSAIPVICSKIANFIPKEGKSKCTKSLTFRQYMLSFIA